MATETPYPESDQAVDDAARAARRTPRIAGRLRRNGPPAGTAGFYVVAMLATAVSVNTNWRFFGQVFHVDNKAERGALSAVLAVALVASAIAIRTSRRPRSARLLAWALCGLSAGIAVELSGLAEGFARVALGPALALVALHLALGIEVRAQADSKRSR